MSIELSGLKTNKSKKKKVWVVTELFYPETISTGYILTEIAKSLKKDYEVSVISGPEYYEKKAERTEKLGPIENIKIHRITNGSYNKNSTISRALGHIKVSVKMLFLMLKTIPKGSEVLMVTNPILLTYLTHFFVNKKGWKIKLLVHDVFPENLVISGLIKSDKSWIYRFIKNRFNHAFNKMDTLIVLGRDMKALFENKLAKNQKIAIIENWADTVNIKAHQIPNTQKTFIFAGNLGRLQGLKKLLEAIKGTQDLNYKVTLIGGGALETEVKEYIQDNNIKSIKKLGWLPRSEQNQFLSKALIGIITLKKGMYGLGVPSKCYNLLASGKPIFYIGDIDSEIYILLKENNIGWFAEAGNLEMIKNTIKEIVNTDLDTINIYSKTARKLAESHYNKNLILNKFNKLFT